MSDAAPAGRSDWTRVAAALLLLAGTAQFALGAAAIAGADRFELNVLEIEANEDFGRLYFSLGTWGWISGLLGLAEVSAAVAAWSRAPNARLIALAVAYGGLAGAFFTLAIFRMASVATIVVLLLVVFLFSYRSG